MASKKKPQMAKYCQIFQFIEELDAEFAGAIKNLCMIAALSPGPGSAGVTFLYPKDDEFRAEIVAKTYSKDADEAVKMVDALIVPDFLGTAEDWTRKPVGSAGHVLYKVKSASAKSVVLEGEKGDVKLEPNHDFKVLTKREGRISVWNIVSGRPPTTGEGYKRPHRAREKKMGGSPSKTVMGGAGPHWRARCAMNVQERYIEEMRKDRATTCDPYLKKMVGLLQYLQREHPATFAAIQPLLDWSPVVSFYILLEPYKSKGDFMIPDGVLTGPTGWNGADGFGNLVTEYKTAINSIENKEGPYVSRDVRSIVSQTDKLRVQILGSHAELANKKRTPKQLVDVYSALISANKIGGLSPILPDATLRLLPGDKKLWQDELRFVLYNALQQVRDYFDEHDLRAVLRNMCIDRPGDNYTKESCLASAQEKFETDVSPNEAFAFVVKFINSTNFLYVPVPETKVGGALGDPIDPRDFSPYNQNHDALKVLNSLRVEPRQTISPHALAEIRAYAKQFGKLPVEVQALVS